MILHALRIVVALIFVGTAAATEFRFNAPGWAVRATFPAAPQTDEQRIPTSQGEEIAERHHLECGAERYLLMRVTYPVPPQTSERAALFRQVIETFMNSRAGEIRDDRQLMLGEYPCHRLLIEHRSERTHREVRLMLVGGALYFASAEWPGGQTPPSSVASFFDSLEISAEFSNSRVADELARWRHVSLGNFQLRYDATRWYRDPATVENDMVLLLRVDELAEAEFVVGPRWPAATMEEVVLATAREFAERVELRRRGRKLQGSVRVEELRFSVRADGVSYENHGYFYNGPEGSAQVRAWSPEKTFPKVESDISELLDGLKINSAHTEMAGR